MKVLVTGGTNGMGKGVAKFLAGSDSQIHEIIILGRSKELGKAVCKELEASTANKKVSFVLCDLTKLSDVRNAIKEIHSQHKFLDGIFINAGLGYATGRVETEDGMDPHFQVNYLSQFMLTLNLLDLLEKSVNGGRVVFNVNKGGEIYWNDLQMKVKWGYENAVQQAMLAKRMFSVHLHNLYSNKNNSQVSFIRFKIPKTVWTNQVNIIPLFMKTIATLVKFFGAFISIEKCGMITAPLFTEDKMESLKKSGKFITQKKNKFVEIADKEIVYDEEMLKKLWKVSVDLCEDERTSQIANKLMSLSS